MNKEQYWMEKARTHKKEGDSLLSDLFWIGAIVGILAVIILMLMRTGDFLWRVLT